MTTKDVSRKQIFGGEDLTKHLNGFLLAQASILKGVTKSEELTDRAKEMCVVLMSSVGIAIAITRLGTKDMLNESTMLTRALLERLINYCYLMVCDEEEYEKYKAYSLQKTYRKLDRRIETSKHSLSIKYTGEINVESIPELKKALDQFTGSKGGEKTRWTDVSLSERVTLVGEKSNADERKWLLSLLSFYEDASEALHGTFYGSTFHTGIHEPGFDRNNSEAIERGAQQKLSLLYWQMGDIIADVISLLGEKYKLKDFVEKSQENSRQTTEIMKFIMKD